MRKEKSAFVGGGWCVFLWKLRFFRGYVYRVRPSVCVCVCVSSLVLFTMDPVVGVLCARARFSFFIFLLFIYYHFVFVFCLCVFYDGCRVVWYFVSNESVPQRLLCSLYSFFVVVVVVFSLMCVWMARKDEEEQLSQYGVEDGGELIFLTDTHTYTHSQKKIRVLNTKKGRLYHPRTSLFSFCCVLPLFFFLQVVLYFVVSNSCMHNFCCCCCRFPPLFLL